MKKTTKHFLSFLILVAFISIFAPQNFCMAKTVIYTDPTSGKTYNFEVKDNGEVKGGNMKGCEALPIKLNSKQKCLFCPLFLVIFNASNDMATKSFEALAFALKVVISVGLAVWIALKILPVVASLSSQEAPKIINEVLLQTFKVVIAYILLSHPTEIYYWVVSPLLKAGLEFGSSVLFTVDMKSISASPAGGSVGQGYIDPAVFLELDRFLQAIQKEIGTLQAIGTSLMCISVNEANILNFIPDFAMLFNGIIIFILATILLISFGFYLTDAVVQLGIVGGLMPLLIACWPFKWTTKWTNTGFNILMNSFFIFVIMGVIISIDIQLILAALGGNLDTMFEAFADDDIDKINDIFDIGVAGGIGLIGCIVLAFKFTEQANSIAGKFSGGMVSGIGSKIGGMAASGATNVAKRVTAPARKKLAKASKEGLNKLGKGIAHSKAGKFTSQTAKKVGDTTKNLANKAGNAVTNTANKASNAIKNSKAGQAVEKTGTAIKDSKVGKGVSKGIDKTKDFLQWDKSDE